MFTGAVSKSLSGSVEGKRSEPEVPRRRSTELGCRTKDADDVEAPISLAQVKAIQKTLRNLYRKSKTDYEERGLNTLFLVCGLLEWHETDRTEPVRSPLLLVPVRMDRTEALAPFSVVLAEGEIALNPALRVKMWNDFHFTLPEAPDSWDTNGATAYLKKVQSRARSKKWSVSHECWLCTLSYHKLVIYEDLDKHTDAVSEHFVTRAVAGTDVSGDLGNSSAVDPSSLDDKVHPSDSFLILDADSSQLSCVEAVKQGRSLVIQGPPGTGKSQTIANIIAESIAQGKKTLFVSEKMAALEVVLKRLTAAKLDHYCLELHSHRANKRDVVAELDRCYREAQRPETPRQSPQEES